MNEVSPRVMVAGLLTAGWAVAQAPWYVGGGAGISTLSGDARSDITATLTAVSQYKPENGPLGHLFAGKHVHEYLSVQGVYSWNRNALALLSTSVTSAGFEATYEPARRSRQHNAAADALIYFRGRTSAVRPFLSVGLDAMRFATTATELRVLKGAANPPVPHWTATRAGLRVAAGMDWMPRGGSWGVRYAFLETIQGNPISPRLFPPGRRGLANFQNLFGVVKYFR